MVNVAQVETEAELEVVRGFMRSFVEWQYSRHSEYRDLIDKYFDPVKLSAE